MIVEVLDPSATMLAGLAEMRVFDALTAAGETVIVPLAPVIVPVTVSVAVIVRLPAWVRVAVKVLVPLSPARKV